ncbi:MAG: hypothetical protein ACYDCQ_03860 [Dehalococcoidia bacterium]
MADLPPYPDTPDSNADTGAGHNRSPTTSRSRWVYALWIGGVAIVLLVVALHLTGVIGPGSH